MVTVTGARTIGNGEVVGVTEPVGSCGEVGPRPVPYNWIIDPGAAGLAGPFTVPSWFRAAAGPLPAPFNAKTAGTKPAQGSAMNGEVRMLPDGVGPQPLVSSTTSGSEFDTPAGVLTNTGTVG
jgi:hypothetical protein